MSLCSTPSCGWVAALDGWLATGCLHTDLVGLAKPADERRGVVGDQIDDALTHVEQSACRQGFGRIGGG